MLPNGENVFCMSSSERPLVRPPQYTVQLVGLDWLYTSSNVSGFVFPAQTRNPKFYLRDKVKEFRHSVLYVHTT